MVEINCINCGKDFTRDYDIYYGVVKCPECNKNMNITVINKKIISINYDTFQQVQDLSQQISKKA
jgi:phage FluMu protein Com